MTCNYTCIAFQNQTFNTLLIQFLEIHHSLSNTLINIGCLEIINLSSLNAKFSISNHTSLLFNKTGIRIFLLAHSPKLMWVEIFLSDNNNFIYGISWLVAWKLSLIIYCCESDCYMPFIICKQKTNQRNHTNM